MTVRSAQPRLRTSSIVLFLVLRVETEIITLVDTTKERLVERETEGVHQVCLFYRSPVCSLES